MKIFKILIVSLFFLQQDNMYAQNDFNLGILLELESFSNYGEIDTYEEITDGYSPNGTIKGYGLEFGYKTVGLVVKKFVFELAGDGFEKPFRTIEAQYDDFPRMWTGKGGSFYTQGYLFEGFSLGIFKTFNLKYFDLKLMGEFGNIDVKIDGHHPSNELFSYSYNTESDFTSRHWAVYNKGNFYSVHIELIRKIWRGLQLYIGLGHRTGSFEYIFREEVRDDLIEENNLNNLLETDKSFNSLGYKFGLKYTISI